MIVTRALGRADAVALLRLLTAIQAVDHGEESHELADVEHELADPTVDLAADSVGVFDDGVLVARARAQVRGTDLAVDGGVDPAVRGWGHGTALIAWARARAVARQVETLSLSAEDSVTGAGELFRAAGLNPVRRWYSMARPVGPGSDPPAGAVAAGTGQGDGLAVTATGSGVVTAAITAADSEALRVLHGVAFSGHFGSRPPGPDRWEHDYVGSPNWRADSSVVVRGAGGDLRGYALGYEWPADAVASGVREAYLGQLGVDPAHRRQGLGSVLLAAFVGRAAAAGYGRVALMVDSENTSGALAMYEAAGFSVTRTSTTYREAVGPVAPVG